MRNKLTRSDIRNFLYEASNFQTLREEVTIMGNKVDIVDGKILFNNKTFKIMSGAFDIPVLNLSDDGDVLSVTLKPPYVPFINSGKPRTATLDNIEKIKELISGFESGQTFDIKLVDEDGELTELTFATV